ncbi:MAG: acylneuraminate cytidylyltransferase [Thaumarchaeota archaeon]|nr:MAG: acylneuraminate cytidylyltransferase [Nitrososphaerota archaeon]
MIGCIIQARIGSERLPRKILKKIDNENTILDYVVNQTSNSEKIEKIVIATTDLNEDEVIEKFCNDRKIDCFRGSVDDVLDRHYQCAKKYSFDPIVRVTSDNPIVDPEIIDLCIKTYEKGQFDMVTTCNKRSYPYGISVEVFSFEALEKSWNKSKLLSEREHVVLYIQNERNNFKIYNLINPEDLTYINCTVDNDEDYQLIQKVVSEIKERPILMKHIVELFKIKPELHNINKNSDPYEGHKASFKKDLMSK